MARFRLSPLAQADIAHILATSADRWGQQGSHFLERIHHFQEFTKAR
jgi:hypothetical protein